MNIHENRFLDHDRNIIVKGGESLEEIVLRTPGSVIFDQGVKAPSLKVLAQSCRIHAPIETDQVEFWMNGYGSSLVEIYNAEKGLQILTQNLQAFSSTALVNGEAKIIAENFMLRRHPGVGVFHDWCEWYGWFLGPVGRNKEREFEVKNRWETSQPSIMQVVGNLSLNTPNALVEGSTLLATGNFYGDSDDLIDLTQHPKGWMMVNSGGGSGSRVEAKNQLALNLKAFVMEGGLEKEVLPLDTTVVIDLGQFKKELLQKEGLMGGPLMLPSNTQSIDGNIPFLQNLSSEIMLQHGMMDHILANVLSSYIGTLHLKGFQEQTWEGQRRALFRQGHKLAKNGTTSGPKALTEEDLKGLDKSALIPRPSAVPGYYQLSLLAVPQDINTHGLGGNDLSSSEVMIETEKGMKVHNSTVSSTDGWLALKSKESGLDIAASLHGNQGVLLSAPKDVITLRKPMERGKKTLWERITNDGMFGSSTKAWSKVVDYAHAKTGGRLSTGKEGGLWTFSKDLQMKGQEVKAGKQGIHLFAENSTHILPETEIRHHHYNKNKDTFGGSVTVDGFYQVNTLIPTEMESSGPIQLINGPNIPFEPLVGEGNTPYGVIPQKEDPDTIYQLMNTQRRSFSNALKQNLKDNPLMLNKTKSLVENALFSGNTHLKDEDKTTQLLLERIKQQETLREDQENIIFGDTAETLRKPRFILLEEAKKLIYNTHSLPLQMVNIEKAMLEQTESPHFPWGSYQAINKANMTDDIRQNWGYGKYTPHYQKSIELNEGRDLVYRPNNYDKTGAPYFKPIPRVFVETYLQNTQALENAYRGELWKQLIDKDILKKTNHKVSPSLMDPKEKESFAKEISHQKIDDYLAVEIDGGMTLPPSHLGRHYSFWDSIFDHLSHAKGSKKNIFIYEKDGLKLKKVKELLLQNGQPNPETLELLYTPETGQYDVLKPLKKIDVERIQGHQEINAHIKATGKGEQGKVEMKAETISFPGEKVYKEHEPSLERDGMKVELVKGFHEEGEVSEIKGSEIIIEGTKEISGVKPNLEAETIDIKSARKTFIDQVNFLAELRAEEMRMTVGTMVDPGLQAIISLAATIATWGAGSAAATGLGFAKDTIGHAMMSAGLSSLAGKGLSSFVMNQGDIGSTFKDITSKESLQGIAMSIGTAGLLKALKVPEITPNSGWKEHLTYHGAKALASTGMKAVMQQKDIGEILKTEGIDLVLNTAASLGASEIGSNFKDDWLIHKTLHGALGAGVAALKGKKPLDGAVAAIVAETAAELLINPEGIKQDVIKQYGKDHAQEELKAIALEQVKYKLELCKMTAGMTAMALGMNAEEAINTADNAVQFNSFMGAYEAIINGDWERVPEEFKDAIDPGEWFEKNLKEPFSPRIKGTKGQNFVEESIDWVEDKTNIPLKQIGETFQESSQDVFATLRKVDPGKAAMLELGGTVLGWSTDTVKSLGRKILRASGLVDASTAQDIMDPLGPILTGGLATKGVKMMSMGLPKNVLKQQTLLKGKQPTFSIHPKIAEKWQNMKGHMTGEQMIKDLYDIPVETYKGKGWSEKSVLVPGNKAQHSTYNIRGPTNQLGEDFRPKHQLKQYQVKKTDVPSNRVTHEKYLSERRANLTREEALSVKDLALQKKLDKLYREHAKIDPKSTAGALRHEKETGKLVGGRSHALKTEENI